MPQKHRQKQYADPALCGGKRIYASEAEAKEIAAQQEMLHFGQKLQLRIYRCITCGKWHLTRTLDDSTMEDK